MGDLSNSFLSSSLIFNMENNSLMVTNVKDCRFTPELFFPQFQGHTQSITIFFKCPIKSKPMWAFSTVYPQEFLIVNHPPLQFEYSIDIAEDKMRREDACL